MAELVNRRSRDVKVFDLGGSRRQAVFTPFTHYQDDQGAWQDVDLNFVADGLDRLIDKHLIAFRADASGLSIYHKPTGRGIRFNFPRRPDRVANRTAEWDLADGTTWRLTARKTGLKTEATVVAKRGPKTYTFSGTMLGGLAPPDPDAAGNLVQPAGHFVIQRPYVTGANGVVYETSGWTRTGGNIRFDFDDTPLPNEALPYVIDPTSTFNVAASGDDGIVVSQTSSSYPPVNPSSSNSSDETFYARKYFFSPDYLIAVGLVRWDTSSIPDDATIDAATFRARAMFKVDVDSRNLTLEWYESGTIGNEDWTNTVGSNAHAGTSIASITTGADNDFALTNVSNVSKTGYTGLRLHISGGAPTDLDNIIEFASFDHATLLEPRLIVVYTEAGGTVTPGVIALVLAAFAPLALTPQTLIPPIASLVLAAFAPIATIGTTLTPTTASLSLTTFAPTVTATANQVATPTTAELTTAPFTPNVLVSGVSEGLVIGFSISFVGEGKVGAPDTVVEGPVTVTPTIASLTLATFAPQIQLVVIPDTASLVLTTFEPSIIHGTVVIPTTLGLTLQTFEATILTPVVVTPTTATLVLTTFAPQANLAVIPTTASLTLTAFAPTVAIPGEVVPGTASLVLTAFAPTVSTPVLVTPDTATLSLTAFAPTASITVLVTPGTLALSLTTFEPTVQVSDNQTVTPTTASLSLTTFAPTITVPGEVIPGTASLNIASFAPSVLTPSTLTPTVIALTIAPFAPTVALPNLVTPTFRALTTSLFAPTVTTTANQLVTPTALALSLSGFAPQANLAVTPTTVALVLSAFAPQAQVAFIPTTASLTITTFEPTVTAHALQTPTTIALVVTLFAPTITVQSAGEPQRITGALDIDAVLSEILDADTVLNGTLDADSVLTGAL